MLVGFFCRYEKAVCDYERCLDVFQIINDSNDGNASELSSSLSSAVLNFLVNEVTLSLCVIFCGMYSGEASLNTYTLKKPFSSRHFSEI